MARTTSCPSSTEVTFTLCTHQCATQRQDTLLHAANLLLEGHVLNVTARASVPFASPARPELIMQPACSWKATSTGIPQSAGRCRGDSSVFASFTTADNRVLEHLPPRRTITRSTSCPSSTEVTSPFSHITVCAQPWEPFLRLAQEYVHAVLSASMC